MTIVHPPQYHVATVRQPWARHPRVTHAPPSIQGGKTVKFRIYKLAFAVASIAALIEVLGAGRRF
jgi:hypothetical protein